MLELEHVKPVDQRVPAIRKADAVLPAFARAGQRHDTLKRVAQRGRCRLLFLFGVKAETRHVWDYKHLMIIAHADELQVD